MIKEKHIVQRKKEREADIHNDMKLIISADRQKVTTIVQTKRTPDTWVTIISHTEKF